MAKKVSRLASRFKAALESAEEDALRAAEALKQAHEDLIDELKALAAELEIITVKKTKKRLTLTLGERSVVLALSDGERIDLSFQDSPPDTHLHFSGREWVLHLGEGQHPLFDEGLEELLVLGLGLPRPTDEEVDDEEELEEEEPVAADAPDEAPDDTPVKVDGTSRPHRVENKDRTAPTSSRKAKPQIGSTVKELKRLW